MLENNNSIAIPSKDVNFAVRKIESGYFIANKFGQWHILKPKQFEQLNNGNLAFEEVEELEKKGLLLTGNNSLDVQNIEKHWHQVKDRNDHQIVIIHLTQRCNLTCSYCHSSAISPNASNKDITNETVVNVVDFVSEIPKKLISIAFQGGEPALNIEEIAYICNGITNDARNKEKVFEFGITTNGTIHSEELFELIDKYNIATTISFDGPKNVHDLIRTKYDGSGSFDQAMEFKRKLSKKSATRKTGAIMVLTRSSIGRVKEIVDQYAEFGQSVIRLKAVTKLGRAKSTWSENSIDFEEYWDAFLEAHEYMLKKFYAKESLLIEHSVLVFIRKLFEKQNHGDVDSRNPCGIVENIISVDIDGKIYACHETKRKKDFVIGNVKIKPDEVFNSDRAKEIRKQAYVGNDPVCQDCAYYSYCTPCVAHNVQQYRQTQMKPFISWECRKTIALCDLVLGDFEKNSEYYVDNWRAWHLSKSISETLRRL